MKTEVCLLAKNELKSLKKIFPIIKKKNKIKFFIQKKNGRGNAMIEAVKKKKDLDSIIFFSPDGNENINDLSKIIKLLKKNDLVIGSRMIDGARNEEDDQIFKFRKWANNFFNFFANCFFNLSNNYITDSINGYRGIKTKIFKKLKLDEKNYAIEYQMTIRSMKKKFKIVEFPTKESNRIAGKSQAPSIPTGLTFIRCLIKEILVGKSF